MSLLAAGSEAPDFEAQDQHGQEVRLRDHRGRWVVLYFYPVDDTPGCTVEACGFRDHRKVLEDAQAVVLGVSTQGVGSHKRFADKHGLDFPLVADPDKVVCKAYGAIGLLGPARRVTYLIDPAGKVAKVWDKVTPRGHAEEVHRALRAAQGGGGEVDVEAGEG